MAKVTATKKVEPVWVDAPDELAKIKVRCMKCREDRRIKKGTAIVGKTANGRNAIKGQCRECGTNVYKFLAADAF